MKILSTLCIALGIAGGLSAPALAQTKPIEAVASFTVLADMVREVGGDRVHVASLVGVNGDPHAYEPTPDDARRLREARLVFVNGLGLEGWMDRLIKASGTRGRVVVATDGIPTRRMREDGHEIIDPHAWNSAANGALYARAIARALAEADPADAPAFTTRGEAYAQQLLALDAKARQQIGAIPAAQRKILTSHDAFGYFGDAYGVKFLSPLGLSTESEASAGDVAKLVEQIKAEHIHTYFIENSNDSRLVRQIAAATGARPGGTLYVESLSAPDGPAPTYLAMFARNLEMLAAAMNR